LIFSCNRSRRANGSESPLMKSVGHWIRGSAPVRQLIGKRAVKWIKRGRIRESARMAAMLDTDRQRIARSEHIMPTPASLDEWRLRVRAPRGRSTAIASCDA